MTQLVLPHTIDAGSEITAVEHQLNYEAIRDVINGGLQGGSGAAGNLAAKGITGREMDAITAKYLGIQSALKPGIENHTDLLVTPGAGLQLSYAAGRAFIEDDGSIHTSGLLIPANVAAGGSVTVASNSSGNPRFDQIILTLSGWDAGAVSVLQGTPNATATAFNRTGAAALPAKAIRLADAFVPNGFVGPFVVGTHLIDRRRAARTLKAGFSAASSIDIPVDAASGGDTDYIEISFNVLTSGLGFLRALPDGFSPSTFSWVKSGAKLVSTPTSSAVGPTGSQNVNTGFLLCDSPDGAASGAVRYVGKATIAMSTRDNRIWRSEATTSSFTGSANHVVEHQDVAGLYVGGGFGFLRFSISTGTMTGTIAVTVR